MTILFLLFCFGLLSKAYCGQPLLEQEVIAKNYQGHGIELIAQDLYNLVLAGNSPDEIIEMFHDKDDIAYNIQALVIKIDELLDQQHSKEEIINIIVENKESQGFVKKAEMGCLLLQLILTVGSVIGLSYFAYLVYNRYFKLPTFKRNIPQMNDQPPDQKQKDRQLKDPAQPDAGDQNSNEEHRDHVDRREIHEHIQEPIPVHLPAVALAQPAQGRVDGQVPAPRDVELVPVLARDQLVDQLRILDANIFNPFGPFQKKAIYDRSLHESVQQQIDLARGLGFE